MMPTKTYLLDKAAQCRRLASGISNPAEPAIATLLALADEFERQAEAVVGEEAEIEEKSTAH